MAKKEKLTKIDSPIPGVMLIVKKGFEQIKILSSKVQKFYMLIKKYRRLEQKELCLKNKKGVLKEKIVEIVAANPGLAGLETKDNIRTSVYESHSTEVIYDRELMKKSLGSAYEGTVLEDLKLTITLTPEYKKEEIIQFLKNFFASGSAYKKLVQEKVILRVDEPKLEQLIKQKQVQLLEGAKTVKESSTWNVKTTPVKE
jgi:hypothetical protein